MMIPSENAITGLALAAVMLLGLEHQRFLLQP